MYLFSGAVISSHLGSGKSTRTRTLIRGELRTIRGLFTDPSLRKLGMCGVKQIGRRTWGHGEQGQAWHKGTRVHYRCTLIIVL